MLFDDVLCDFMLGLRCLLIEIFFTIQIDSIQLMMDSETGRSKGYGFITVSLCFLLLKFC